MCMSLLLYTLQISMFGITKIWFRVWKCPAFPFIVAGFFAYYSQLFFVSYCAPMYFLPVLPAKTMCPACDRPWKASALSPTSKVLGFVLVFLSFLWTLQKPLVLPFPRLSWPIMSFFCFWLSLFASTMQLVFSTPLVSDSLWYAPFSLTSYMQYYSDYLDTERFGAMTTTRKAATIYDTRRRWSRQCSWSQNSLMGALRRARRCFARWWYTVCKTGNKRGSPNGTVLCRNAVQLDANLNNKRIWMSGIHILRFWTAVYTVYVNVQENNRSGIYEPLFSRCPIMYTAVQYYC